MNDFMNGINDWLKSIKDIYDNGTPFFRFLMIFCIVTLLAFYVNQLLNMITEDKYNEMTYEEILNELGLSKNDVVKNIPDTSIRIELINYRQGFEQYTCLKELKKMIDGKPNDFNLALKYLDTLNKKSTSRKKNNFKKR